MVNRIEAFLLIAAITLLPFYVFPSGSIQPYHLTLFVFSLIVFLHYGLKKQKWSTLLLLLFFYILVVESLYVYLGDADPISLIHPAYFLYNYIISAAIYTYLTRNESHVLVYGLLFVTVFSIVSLIYFGVDYQAIEGAKRAAGSFNNPNQLGFFSVCLLSFTYLLYIEKQLKYLFAVLIIMVAVIISISSLSKAAMIANFAVLYLAMKPKIKGGYILIGLVIIIPTIVMLWVAINLGFFDNYLFYLRLVNFLNEQDSSLAVRGYYAFLEAEFYQFIFGLGAENLIDIVGGETHSTVFGVLNQYGLIGFIILVYVLLIWARNLLRAFGWTGLVCIAGPSMLYGITHNGIRFTFFWILFSASMAFSKKVITTNSE